MISKNVVLVEGKFAGVKLKRDGIVAGQFPSLNFALKIATNLDKEATGFEYEKKDGTKEVVKL